MIAGHDGEEHPADRDPAAPGEDTFPTGSGVAQDRQPQLQFRCQRVENRDPRGGDDVANDVANHLDADSPRHPEEVRREVDCRPGQDRGLRRVDQLAGT